MPQIALITGANRGLGLEIARQLGRAGAAVIVAARDPVKGERAAELLRGEGLDAESVALDVRSVESVQGAAREIERRHGRLDILINNAGILPEATAETDGALDLRLFVQTYETNVFGAVAVTQELLPLLVRSDAGRIVNVSTTMGSLSDAGDPSSPYSQVVAPAYRSSKAALNAITIALAKRLKGTPIKVNSVCPGFVQTDLTPLNRSQAPLTPEEAAPIFVEMATIGDDGPSGAFVDRRGSVAW